MLNLELALKCARLSSEGYGKFASIKFSTANAQVTLVEAAVPELANAASTPPKTDTQAALLHEADQNQVILVFRGSESRVDWFNNAQFRIDRYSTFVYYMVTYRFTFVEHFIAKTKT